MGSIGEPAEVWEALEQVYMSAANKGELPIRVFAMVPLSTWYCPRSFTLTLQAARYSTTPNQLLTLATVSTAYIPVRGCASSCCRDCAEGVGAFRPGGPIWSLPPLLPHSDHYNP